MPQHGDDVFEVVAVPALRQEHRFAFAATDARVFHVDVDDRFVAQFAIDPGFLEADQERALGDRARQVVCVPAAVLHEQVLALREAQQGDRLPRIAVAIPAQEDRVLALQLGVFGGKRGDHADVVAEFAAEAGDDAQTFMHHIVQHCVSGHGVSSSRPGPANVPQTCRVRKRQCDIRGEEE